MLHSMKEFETSITFLQNALLHASELGGVDVQLGGVDVQLGGVDVQVGVASSGACQYCALSVTFS